jgi:PmbA protein
VTAPSDLVLNGQLAGLSRRWAEAAAWALERAMAKGAHAADVCVQVGRTIGAEIDASRLEHAHLHEEQSVSLRCFDAAGAMGTAWWHGMPTRRDAAKLADKAAQLMALGEPVEGFFGLPKPAPRPNPSGLYDEQLAALTPQRVIELADAQRTAVLQQEPRAIISGSLAACADEMLLINSAGLHLEVADTRFELSIDVTLPGDELSTYSEESFGRELQRLADATTALQALQGARAYQGRRPGKGQRTTVLLAPWAVANLMDELADAASAEAMQRRKSWLTDRLGESIAGGGWTVIDDGLADGGYDTRGFDEDGAPRRVMTILDGGRFANCLHNLWTAGRAGATNTGHGTRSRDVEPTNLRSQPGDQSVEKLLADVGDGVIIDDLEWEIDLATGQFACSLGYARRVAGGQITHGLDGLMWAGQVFDLLRRIDAVSRDGRSQPGIFWPTLRVRDAQLISQD